MAREVQLGLLPAVHDGAQVECVALLQQLIRSRTVNPPGDELPLARVVADALAADGIASEVIETAPGRGCTIARLRGSGAARPLLLLAHLDVVEVDAARWTTDPFGGEIRDGFLYGRGAIDDKGMLAVNLMTMRLLKREVLDRGGSMARDVVFVAAADEEAGSDWGLGWLLAHRPELLEAEFALNEGGRIRVVDGRARYAAVQVAEKVPHRVWLTARGHAGHGSVPRPDNAIVHLALAVAAAGRHREPLVLGPVSREFFRSLAAVWPEPALAAAMAELTSGVPDAVRRGAEALAAHPTFDAVLRNGISPVHLSGGRPANVIPAEAAAALDVRTLPGESLDALLDRLRTAIADPLVEIRVDGEAIDAPASPVDSPLYAAIAGSLRAAAPDLAVVPYLSTGATDNARLRQAGIPAYGLLPFPLTETDEQRMHGHDERVPLDALAFGLRVVFGAVHRVATLDGGFTPDRSTSP